MVTIIGFIEPRMNLSFCKSFFISLKCKVTFLWMWGELDFCLFNFQVGNCQGNMIKKLTLFLQKDTSKRHPFCNSIKLIFFIARLGYMMFYLLEICSEYQKRDNKKGEQVFMLSKRYQVYCSIIDHFKLDLIYVRK